MVIILTPYSWLAAKVSLVLYTSSSSSLSFSRSNVQPLVPAVTLATWRIPYSPSDNSVTTGNSHWCPSALSCQFHASTPPGFQLQSMLQQPSDQRLTPAAHYSFGWLVLLLALNLSIGVSSSPSSYLFSEHCYTMKSLLCLLIWCAETRRHTELQERPVLAMMSAPPWVARSSPKTVIILQHLRQLATVKDETWETSRRNLVREIVL